MNKSRRFLCVVLSVLMLLGMASAMSVSFAATEGAFDYTVNNEKATLTAYNGTDAAVTVPATLGGYPVTGIGKKAFAAKAITSVSLPEGVTQIATEAFKDSALQSISLPATLLNIADGAFMNTALSELAVPESVTYIGVGAVSGCTKLACLQVPFVGNAAGENNYFGAIFDAVKAGENAAVPSALKEIIVSADDTLDQKAFYGFDKVEHIVWSKAPKSIGGYAFYNCKSLNNLEMAFTAADEIGAYAFYGCQKLESISLPARITGIGAFAFAGCTALKTISAGAKLSSVGEAALQNTAWLAEQADGPVLLSGVMITYKGKAPDQFTVPSNVTALADKALADRSDIKELVIPATVKYIGVQVLQNNTVAAVSIPYFGASAADNRTAYLGYLFGYGSEAGNAKLPKTLTTITLTDMTSVPTAAMAGASKVKTLTIGESVKSVKTRAFADCTALDVLNFNPVNATIENGAFDNSNVATVSFGKTVKTIPANLCTNNYNLKSVTISEGVERIEARAFAGCYNMTKLTFNAKNCTTIAADAFLYCHRLNDIEIGSSVEHIPANLFSEYGGSNITEIEIPAGIKSIDAGAFAKCTLLETLYYNATNCTIGQDAFSKCTKLNEVLIGKEVTTVPANLYSGNTALNCVILPENVTAIAPLAFADCTELTNIFVGEGLLSVGKDAMKNTKWYDLQEDGDVYLGRVYYAAKGTHSGEVVLDGQTTAIADGAFAGQKNITKVDLPVTVKMIGETAFDNTNPGLILSCYDTAEYVISYATAHGLTLSLKNCPHTDTYYKVVDVDLKKGTAKLDEICQACGATLSSGEFSLDDPMEGKWVLVEEPTCTEPGMKQRVIGTTTEEIAVPAKGHAPGEWVMTEEPSCKAEGTKVLVCIDCGEELDTKSIAKTDHVHGTWKDVKPARTYCKGLRAKVCDVCGVYLDTKEIDKLTVPENQEIFLDVMSSDWYSKTVYFAYNNGLFEGVDDTHFAPEEEMTRAMFVTVLGRLAGVSVKNNVSTKFTDVEKKKWYTGYIKWASDNGIVDGVSKTRFAPNAPITREQLCTMIVRYCNYAGITLTDKVDEVFFKDNDQISLYAVKNIQTCQRAGIVNGRGNGYFAPKATATRAEVAKLLQNFAENWLAD